MTDLEFYRDQYYHEIDRSRFLDNVVSFPTTLIVIFIGGVVYSFSKYFSSGFPCKYEILDIVFIVLLVFFAVSTVITIIYLFTVFHGFTRKYSYLPYTKEIHNHEKIIFRYYYKNSEKQGKKEKQNDSISLTCENLEKSLINYFIELADANQRINDKRSDNYFITRTFLFFDLILFIPVTIIGLLK